MKSNFTRSFSSLLTGAAFFVFTLMGYSAFAQPANDLCANATAISCGQTLSGTTINATFDNAGSCSVSNTAPGVWYKITGTGAGITLSTCSAVGYDTKLSVFSGSCGSLVCVSGNDDDFACSFSSLRSKVTFNSVNAVTYYVLVHGFSASTGNFELTATCAAPPSPPPANDLCSGAITVTCGQTVSGSTANATADVAPFCGTSDGTGGGVWYKLVGNGLPATLSLCSAGTSFDTKIRVYTGSCGGLVCAAGNDDDTSCSFSSLRSTVNFNTANGVTYYILVHGFSSANGTYELSVECADPCNPDDTDPSITCISGTVSVQLGPEGTYTFSGNELVNSASDACGQVSISYSPATVSCATLGSQVINVTATDGSNNTASCSKTVTVAAGGDLPEEWDASSIGSAHGTATFPSCGEPTYILATNGNTTLTVDGLFFVNQPLCGDGSITVKVESVTPQGWAGIMMRETNATGSKKVGLKTKLLTQLGREIRSTTNGIGTTSLTSVPPGRNWLRITRSGNNFSGYSSPNGVTWYFAFSVNVTMSSCIEMGMYTESYNHVDISTGVFTNVSVTGGIPNRPVADTHTNATQVDIFPNPTTDDLNVNLTGFAGQATTLRLLNGLGQTVLNRDLGQVDFATETLSLGNLPKGIYLLSVESAAEQKVFRVVKD